MAGSAEQDPVSEQPEACSAIHLSLEEFDLGVGALDRAVAVGHGQCRDHRWQVLAQATDEGMQWGSSLASTALIQPSSSALRRVVSTRRRRGPARRGS